MIISKRLKKQGKHTYWEVIQEGKEDSYERFRLPSNGDKNASIMINSYLTAEDVKQILEDNEFNTKE